MYQALCIAYCHCYHSESWTNKQTHLRAQEHDLPDETLPFHLCVPSS